MVFFFSSRRRHTRCGRDWSSDVCSSDLLLALTRLKRPIACPWLPTSPSKGTLRCCVIPNKGYSIRIHLCAIEQFEGRRECLNTGESHRLKDYLYVGDAFLGEGTQRFGKHLWRATKCSRISTAAPFCWVDTDRQCTLQRRWSASDFLTGCIHHAAQWRNFLDPAPIRNPSIPLIGMAGCKAQHARAM